METQILTPLLNRAGDFTPDGFFHLVSKGRHPITVPGADGKPRTFIQVVDDKATAAMFASFNRKKEADPSYRMLVDFEHFSHQKDKSTEAAAWVDAMENRADGIWFQGEWSDIGAAAVKNKRYRTISPVWFPNQTERLSATEFRPLEINDAGLTNRNNLQGLVPFWNRVEDFHGREATNENSNQGNPMKDRLILLCGLAATATDEQIVAAVEAFKNRASTADTLQTQLTKATSDHEALKNRHTTLLTTSVTRVLDENKDLIPEGQKEAWKNRLNADFEGTSALLAGLKRPEVKKPVHRTEKPAGAAATTDADGEQHPFLNRVAELRAADTKLSEGDAILRAATEKPELYDAYRNDLGSAAE